METFRKLIVHRGVILLSGITAFVATCATLSPDSVSAPQLWGFGIYFLCGLLLFRCLRDALRLILFFAPFSITIFIALTDNPGLFPDVVPLLIITCLCGFCTGSLLVNLLHRKRVRTALVVAAAGTLYICGVVTWLAPLIVFTRQNEPIAVGQLINHPPEFVNHLERRVVLNTKTISVIDFWFTKCGVCYPNNDYLNGEAAKYKQLGVDFYLVYMGNTDSFGEFRLSQKKVGWGNLIPLYDSMGSVSKMLNLEGAPHTLVVSDGKIIYHQSGFSEETRLLETRKLNDIIMNEIARNADSKTIFAGIENTIDLGEVDPLRDSVFTYRLQNTFSQPLSIQDVKGSCNCLVSDWTKKPIARHDFGSISFKLEYDSASADAKTIMISTSSGTTPYTIVNLSYKIKGKGLKK